MDIHWIYKSTLSLWVALHTSQTKMEMYALKTSELLALRVILFLCYRGHSIKIVFTSIKLLWALYPHIMGKVHDIVNLMYDTMAWPLFHPINLLQ